MWNNNGPLQSIKYKRIVSFLDKLFQLFTIFIKTHNSMMCTLFKVVEDIGGPLYSLLPESRVGIRETCLTTNLNYRAFNLILSDLSDIQLSNLVELLSTFGMDVQRKL